MMQPLIRYIVKIYKCKYQLQFGWFTCKLNIYQWVQTYDFHFVFTADFGKDMDMNQLKSTLTCKICLTDIIGIIFVPCGHLGEWKSDSVSYSTHYLHLDSETCEWCILF